MLSQIDRARLRVVRVLRPFGRLLWIKMGSRNRLIIKREAKKRRK